MMTVKELRKILKTMPKDAIVVLTDCAYGDPCHITSVTQRELVSHDDSRGWLSFAPSRIAQNFYAEGVVIE